MRRFKWIEWNLDKIAAHALSPEEVEAAFDWRMITGSVATGRLKCFRKRHRDVALRLFGVTTAGATRFPTYSARLLIQLFL